MTEDLVVSKTNSRIDSDAVLTNAAGLLKQVAKGHSVQIVADATVAIVQSQMLIVSAPIAGVDRKVLGGLRKRDRGLDSIPLMYWDLSGAVFE